MILLLPTSSKIKGGTHPITGEGFIWADRAGATILDTKEAFPGLIVAGMAENAVAG
jgi:ribulose 1,5-bisphosphate synthetase/thiazole synthase